MRSTPSWPPAPTTGADQVNRSPSLFVTVDADRGLALVRGPSARQVTWLLAGDVRRWSRSGRGWVVPAAAVPDIRTYGEEFRELCVVSQRKRNSDEEGAS